jgi:hypothetical protein
MAGLRLDEVNFSIYKILEAALGPGVYSASSRNRKIIKFLGSKVQPVRGVDNL